MPLSGKEIIKRLMKRGWIVKSQKGSHVKLIKDGRVVMIPVHGNRDLGIGLIHDIEKQSEEKLK